MSGRAKLFLLIVVGCAAAAIAAVFVARDRWAASAEAAPGAASALPAAQPDRPFILFRNATHDADYGRVGFVAADGGSRQLTSLRCDRVYFAGGRGVCIGGVDALRRAKTTIFDRRLRKLGTVTVSGFASRARVSRDGSLASTTTFVSGHQYTSGFSTQTTLIDVGSRKRIAQLEEFRVTRDGKAFRKRDFNFWGVTFVPGSRRFYATLASGGRTYLVEGDIATRTAHTIRENVECPSLSPSGTKIAYKYRVAQGRWRLHVLELATMRDHALAETKSVDDQAEWLDDDQVLYGRDGTVWVVPADGSGKPRRLIEDAESPAVVRSS